MSLVFWPILLIPLLRSGGRIPPSASLSTAPSHPPCNQNSFLGLGLHVWVTQRIAASASGSVTRGAPRLLF
ncbi:hypothetical protein LY78DRAFT_653339 [Colletotrichum sublineola]|nr:hypothetical protein LY78DRAFT_653339 [Colletotrichum sublineola]